MSACGFTMADHLDAWPEPIDGCACDRCASTETPTSALQAMCWIAARVSREPRRAQETA